jgi:hypothetical protein
MLKDYKVFSILTMIDYFIIIGDNLHMKMFDLYYENLILDL